VTELECYSSRKLYWLDASWRLVRRVIFRIARSNYSFYLAVRWFFRTAKFYYVFCKVKLRKWINIDKTHIGAQFINIDALSVRRFENDKILHTCKYSDIGLVRSGAWDQGGMPVHESLYYESIRDLMSGAKLWSQTQLYKHLKERLEEGEIVQGIRSQADLDGKGEEIKGLYHNISVNGYSLQRDLPVSHPLFLADEVSVNIGRNGELLLVDGGHRLVIAQLLKLHSIPVRVCIRHAQWVEFREKIRGFSQQHGGQVYQPLLHPDLQDIQSCHGDERFDVLSAHLPQSPATILDLGANWGYFSQRLEEKGYQCTAIENDPEHLYFLRRFREIHGRHFTIVNQSILDLKDPVSYDVVLALNLFHHFLRFPESFNRLIHFLERLKTKMVFFQPHLPEDFRGVTLHRNYSPEEFADLVKSHLGLQCVEQIGQASDGRSLFKIS